MIKKVLSVEDDEITQMLTELVLQDGNFCNVFEKAFNGEEALDLFKSIDENGVPELILLDINMPIMGGWEFLDIFQELYPQFIIKTKIFLLSSSINPKDVERSKQNPHVIGFLSKPLDDEQVEKLKSFFEDDF